MSAIDIVIATRNRVELLKRTLLHIVSRTRTPYRLHVIDDASTDETVDAIVGCDLVASVLSHDRQLGIAANLRELLTVAKSDPLVYVDDDVLCPDVEPDWLARLLTEMESRPALGILGLNNPQAHPKVAGDTRRIRRRDGAVTLCRNIGGTFAMIRRAVLEAVKVPDGLQSPFKSLCIRVEASGYGSGYLTETYCQHIGATSTRRGSNWSADLALVAPLDARTLEPPEEYRG